MNLGRKGRNFNPAYQANRNACAKAYHQRYKSEPLYAELVRVRKRISSRRDLITSTMNRVRTHERDLIALVQRRGELDKLWLVRRRELQAMAGSPATAAQDRVSPTLKSAYC